MKEKGVEKASPVAKKKGVARLGIREKLYLFLLIPLIIIFSISSFITIRQTVSLIQKTTNDSSLIVTKMAENEIRMVARSVASQVKIYLMSKPDLKKEDFKNDPEFSKLAVQAVGKTGYTALFELPDESGTWITWEHENKSIIGVDMAAVKDKLGPDKKKFWQIFTGVSAQKESEGYYVWKDADGSLRNKYMVCTTVEGTRFKIASTTYIDEFTNPMKTIETSSKKTIAKIINFIFAGSIIVILSVIIIIFLYSRSLISKIRYLANAADQISIGNMDTQIDIKSKDEIGELAEAISRMQESVHLAIMRLRRR